MRHESMPQMWKEWHERKGVPRKPLYTLKEISEKYDISIESLRYKLGQEGAPKAKLTREQMKSASNRKYYDADEVIAWCKKEKTK